MSFCLVSSCSSLLSSLPHFYLPPARPSARPLARSVACLALGCRSSLRLNVFVGTRTQTTMSTARVSGASERTSEQANGSKLPSPLSPLLPTGRQPARRRLGREVLILRIAKNRGRVNLSFVHLPPSARSSARSLQLDVAADRLTRAHASSFCCLSWFVLRWHRGVVGVVRGRRRRRTASRLSFRRVLWKAALRFGSCCRDIVGRLLV